MKKKIKINIFNLLVLIGFILAVILWWNEKFRLSCEPYLIILNSLPKIALGPMIILWVGSGSKATIVMCILICVVITTISMLNAFISCDHDKILLMKSMHASKWQILTKLVIPSSLPNFISMLKINVGMAWIGSIMGVYIVSKAGIGYLIVYGGQVFKLDLVMSAVFILCVLAAAMYALVALLERLVIKNK